MSKPIAEMTAQELAGYLNQHGEIKETENGVCLRIRHSQGMPWDIKDQIQQRIGALCGRTIEVRLSLTTGMLTVPKEHAESFKTLLPDLFTLQAKAQRAALSLLSI